jgi:Domain of unknown function (DUF6457)
VDAIEWSRRFADAVGSDPLSEEEIELILEVAAIAAHASERTAAPLTCWLAARAHIHPQAAKSLAERMAGEPD